MQKKVVVIGGGTGSYTVLSGLKKYPLDITAVVAVTDSGGSTGRLRDEFGSLPVGDFRMALVALAEDAADSDTLRKLFLYRFSKGIGLKGHNFGNLFLIALSDILGSYDKALENASRILRIGGRVLPVSSKNINLIAQYEDGSTIEGESLIDEPPESHDGTMKITGLFTNPRVSCDSEAVGAILDADLIVLGPGDLYTSTLANIVVPGIPQALQKTSAKLICVVNLMTKYGQTYGFSATDHVNELTKYIGRIPDFVLVNSAELPGNIIERYKGEQGNPVIDDLSESSEYVVVRKDLLAPEEVIKPTGDILKRSLIRHDPEKLAWEIFKISKEYF